MTGSDFRRSGRDLATKSRGSWLTHDPKARVLTIRVSVRRVERAARERRLSSVALFARTARAAPTYARGPLELPCVGEGSARTRREPARSSRRDAARAEVGAPFIRTSHVARSTSAKLRRSPRVVNPSPARGLRTPVTSSAPSRAAPRRLELSARVRGCGRNSRPPRGATFDLAPAAPLATPRTLRVFSAAGM